MSSRRSQGVNLLRSIRGATEKTSGEDILVCVAWKKFMCHCTKNINSSLARTGTGPCMTLVCTASLSFVSKLQAEKVKRLLADICASSSSVHTLACRHDIYGTADRLAGRAHATGRISFHPTTTATTTSKELNNQKRLLEHLHSPIMA